MLSFGEKMFDQVQDFYRALPRGIDWSKRAYLIDAKWHFPGRENHSSLDDVGPFCIRWREVVPVGPAFEGRRFHANGIDPELFNIRGEAQEYCDWLNRHSLGWYFYWPSYHRLVEIP